MTTSPATLPSTEEHRELDLPLEVGAVSGRHVKELGGLRHSPSVSVYMPTGPGPTLGDEDRWCLEYLLRQACLRLQRCTDHRVARELCDGLVALSAQLESSPVAAGVALFVSAEVRRVLLLSAAPPARVAVGSRFVTRHLVGGVGRQLGFGALGSDGKLSVPTKGEAKLAAVQARLDTLARAAIAGHCRFGIDAAWQAALEGSAQECWVEDGYVYPVRPSADSLRLVPLSHTGLAILDDGVDEILERIDASCGAVHVLASGTLSGYGRIAVRVTPTRRALA